jgi:hypothetical protein
VVVFARLAGARRGSWVLLVALAIVLAACGDRGGSDTSTATTRRSTSTTNSTATSSTSLPDDASIRTAYEAANRAFIDAAAIPDPDAPSIAATHTGEMLRQTRDILRALKADGRVIRYPPNSQYRIVIESLETSGDVSRLHFCAVDDGQRVDAKTGQVISEGVVTARGEAALRFEGGAWKLAEQKFDSRTEGASCD